MLRRCHVVSLCCSCLITDNTTCRPINGRIIERLLTFILKSCWLSIVLLWTINSCTICDGSYSIRVNVCISWLLLTCCSFNRCHNGLIVRVRATIGIDCQSLRGLIYRVGQPRPSILLINLKNLVNSSIFHLNSFSCSFGLPWIVIRHILLTSIACIILCILYWCCYWTWRNYWDWKWWYSWDLIRWVDWFLWLLLEWYLFLTIFSILLFTWR